MYKTKAIAIFYRLSRAEKIAFRKFVQSPYHNRSQKVVALLEHLYPLDTHRQREQLNRRAVHRAVFGTASFDWPALRHVASALAQLLEKFLLSERDAATIEEQLALSAIYQQKQLPHLAEQAFRKAEKTLNNYPKNDQCYLELCYLLEQNRHQQDLEKGRAAVNNVQALNSTFDRQYIAGKLKHACRILSYQGMYKQQYDLGLLPAVLDYVQARPSLLETPLIALYYSYYQAATVEEQAATYFDQFKHYLLQYQTVLEREEIKDLYILATNYSIRVVNRHPHKAQFLATFELFEQALQQGVLLEQERMSPFAYTNIMAVAIGSERYAWGEEFLETYKRYLPPQVRQACVAYNRSRWYFYQGQYRQAAHLLRADNFEDVHLNLSAKILLLKVYYALEELQLLEGLLNRFNTFLSRQRDLAYHKKNYNNIIRFTRRLVALNPYSAKAKAKLRQEITNTPLLTEKTWLLEQLDKLDKLS
jgi:hypothetical protein